MHYPKERKCDFCEKVYCRENIAKRFCSEMCRFMSKVDIKGGCWIWKKGFLKGKYGAHSFNGKGIAAHRASYILFRGSVPEKLFVCHSCDNPSCVNPSHLWLGRAKENNRDRSLKGRSSDRRGEKHHLSKLTNEDVMNIRKLLKNKNQAEISKIYSVDPSCISHIKRKRNWAHL